MARWSSFFPVLLLLLLAAALHCPNAAAAAGHHTCVHGTRRDQLTTGVRAPGAGHGVKRQSQQPIRFTTFPDSTVSDDLPESKKKMILEEVMPALLSSLSDTLSLTPQGSALLLDRSCSGGGYFAPELGSTVRRCVDSCVTSMCGTVVIPPEHLKRCIQCNGEQPPACSLGDPSTDGAGVPDTDYIIYISANQGLCPGSSVVAFAGACQMESTLDRPIAGYINFCPDTLGDVTTNFLYSIAKHEILHALAFSSSLFPFWRDSNGDPRTDRDADGLPPFNSNTGMFQAGESTVSTVTYTSWDTSAGTIAHTVSVLLTEAVVREGKAQFGCEELEGVELENQGGESTALQHWEKRMLGNEAMTGVFDFNPIFSRLTLAVLQDSGWYTVDYSAAQPLLWGKDRGCGFFKQGCRGQLDQANVESNPFCDPGVEDAKTLGCTLNRESIAKCNLVDVGPSLPADFTYFSGSRATYGGGLTVSDYCPYYREFLYGSGRNGNCSNVLNQPNDATDVLTRGEDVYGETYGQTSQCVRQGRVWEKTFTVGGRTQTLSNGQYGGGCYRVECSATDGVTVYVRDFPFKCGCEGEEHLVDVTDCDFRFKGSIVCPSCASVCSDVCPPSEPASCYDIVIPSNEQTRSNCTATSPSTESPTGSTSPSTESPTGSTSPSTESPTGSTSPSTESPTGSSLTVNPSTLFVPFVMILTLVFASL